MPVVFRVGGQVRGRGVGRSRQDTGGRIIVQDDRGEGRVGRDLDLVMIERRTGRDGGVGPVEQGRKVGGEGVVGRGAHVRDRGRVRRLELRDRRPGSISEGREFGAIAPVEQGISGQVGGGRVGGVGPAVEADIDNQLCEACVLRNLDLIADRTGIIGPVEGRAVGVQDRAVGRHDRGRAKVGGDSPIPPVHCDGAGVGASARVAAPVREDISEVCVGSQVEDCPSGVIGRAAVRCRVRAGCPARGRGTRQREAVAGGRGRIPAVVKNVEQFDELVRCFLTARDRRMVIARRIVQRVAVVGDNVLLRAVVEAVVVVWAGQHVVEIEDGHVGLGIVVLGQPVVIQPLVKGAGVGGIRTVPQRRGGDDDEKFFGMRAEVRQDLVVDPLGMSHRQPAVRVGRVAGTAFQRGVGEAGLEHDDLILATGVCEGARVTGVLRILRKQSGHVRGRIPAGEPFRPVGDVGAVADVVWAPAVVSIADEIIVLAEGESQPAVVVTKPVLAGGMVDEDQLDGGGRRKWLCLRCPGLGQKADQSNQ